jgi:hypothetical protein
MRRPEDVIIFRSDNDPLLFDVSGIRVLSYVPDSDPDTARSLVTNAVVDALKFSAIADQWSVDRTIESLDPLAIAMLFGVGKFPLSDDLRDMKLAARDTRWAPAIQRLLGLAAIRTKVDIALSETKPTASLDDMSSLELTDLGIEVMVELLERTGIWRMFGTQVPEIARGREEWQQRRNATPITVRPPVA